MIAKRKIVIEGPKVHDVGYRLFLLEEAESLLIPYFSARNLKDKMGVVEVLVGAEKDKLEKFIDIVENHSPEDAEVSSISIQEYDGEIRTIEAYSRSFSISQLSKIARTGVAMLNTQLDMKGDLREIKEKQDEHIGITKEMRDRQDEHIGITKEMRDRQDEHIKVTRNGFESVSDELKVFKEVREDIRDLDGKFDDLKNSLKGTD